MTCCLNKNIYSRSKNWVSLIKSVEIRQKRAVRPYYANLYAYAANNPVKYTDPDGNIIILIGGCVNAGAGTGGAECVGGYILIDGKGNVSVGMYSTTSVGAFASYGWSAGGEITIAPFATDFSDIAGYSLSAGGSGPTPLGFNAGGEVGFNPNAEGPLAKLKSVTITIAATTPGLPEGHIYNNYTVSLFEISLTKEKSSQVQQQIQTYMDNEDYEGLQNYLNEVSKEAFNE